MTIHKHAPAPNRDAGHARQQAPDDASWECGDCGWVLRQEALPEGMSVADVSEAHADKYCGRPSYWAPL